MSWTSEARLSILGVDIRALAIAVGLWGMLQYSDIGTMWVWKSIPLQPIQYDLGFPSWDEGEGANADDDAKS